MNTEKHRLNFSIDTTNNIISIVDMTANTALRIVENRVQSNNVDIALIIAHLHSLQNTICRSDLQVTNKRTWFQKSKTFQITESSDTEIEIKYVAEKAHYKDNVLECTTGYDKTYALRIINSLYDNLFQAATNTINKHSTFQHNVYHDLLICQTDTWQIVGRWSNFNDGFLKGALVNGTPFNYIILALSNSGKDIDVFDNNSKLLFTMPFDSSANILFKLEGGKENVPKFAI